MGVDDSTPVQVATEGILVSSPRVIGNFNPSTLTGRVVVDIEVGGLVEPVDHWSDRWRCEIVVNVSVAARNISQGVSARTIDCAAYTVTSLSSPGNGGISARLGQDSDWCRLVYGARKTSKGMIDGCDHATTNAIEADLDSCSSSVRAATSAQDASINEDQDRLDRTQPPMTFLPHY